MFTVKCCKCGKEHKLKDIIKVYEWTIDVECGCGNNLKRWYNSTEEGK